MSQIEIYKSEDGEVELQVNLDSHTVWLNRQQFASLFGRDVKTIGKHINNVFNEKELVRTSTVANFATVQKEGKRVISREIEHYNLNVIISVGYRVKSKRGSQFRQWATQKLKDYLVKGYSLNEKRLTQVLQNMQHLEATVKKIQEAGHSEQLKLNEAKGLLEIISNYTQSFILLNQFDSQTLGADRLNANITYEIEYKEALSAIAELKKQLIKKKEASELFGNQKDDSFAGILGSIVQTFDGEYLYKSIEEQAAHLLYFVIKNHPFNDGNKRIGAFMFIWFLEKNKHRFKKSGELKINDNALVALALLVAQSDPADKEIMAKLIVNLIRS